MQTKYELNIGRLVAIVRKSGRSFVYWGLGSFVLAVIVAFSIPRIYKAGVLLAPETSSNSLMSNMSSLASMVGLNANPNPTGDAIYPEIYPELFSSPEFITGLFDIQVESSDGSIRTSYYNYLRKHQKIEWWSFPAIWLQKLMRSLEGGNGMPSGNGGVDPFQLTREQYGVMTTIQKNVICSVDKKTSVIYIGATAQDARIAAILADSVTQHLQAFITKYKTKKAVEDLAYLDQLQAEALADYNAARRAYAQFSDANVDAFLQSVRTKSDELENEMQLKYNIYSQITQQAQMAKARIQEKTPAFTTLQSATIPIKHSNTPKIIIAGVFVILGLFVRLMVLLFKHRNELFIRPQAQPTA